MRWAALIVCLLVLSPATGKAASFDCEKAKTALERTICGDDYLSSLDIEVARFYRTAEARPDLLAEQRQWNKDNAGQCFPADDKAAKKCLTQRYEERRLALLDVVRREALAKAPETSTGPYSFKLVAFHLSDSNNFSYAVLSKQPAEIADAFNALVVPPDKQFLDLCEEQSDEVRVETATDRMVTVRKDFWMYCQGAAHGYGVSAGNTIMMRPKPHLIEARDLFRPGSPWQERLAEQCVHNVKAERSLDTRQEEEVRELAIDPRNWVVTPETLNINLGNLDGSALPMVDVDVAWKHLDGLLLDDLPFTPQ